MKYLALSFGLIATLSCAAQKNDVALECIGDDILYRGYQNKVTVKAENIDIRKIRLIGANVTMKNGHSPNEYIVKPMNQGPISTLHVVTVEGANIDTLTSVNYRIHNLPYPSIHWGGLKSGGIGNITAQKLSIEYPEGVELPNNFKIVSWEITANDEVVSGNGNDVSTAEEFLKKIESGTTLLFIIKVLSADGITRLASAQWEVHSWDEETGMNPLKFDR